MTSVSVELMVRPQTSQADENYPRCTSSPAQTQHWFKHYISYQTSVESIVIGKNHIKYTMLIHFGFVYQSAQVEQFSIGTITYIDAVAVVPKGISQYG